MQASSSINYQNSYHTALSTANKWPPVENPLLFLHYIFSSSPWAEGSSLTELSIDLEHATFLQILYHHT